MATQTKCRCFRFGLHTCFALMVLAALLTRFAIEPEIRRQRTFRTLRDNAVIGAPLVTLFSGRAPSVYDPVHPPAWFEIRQKIARTLWIQTEPWCENCVLHFDRNDKSLADLVNSCEDLTQFINRKYFESVG